MKEYKLKGVALRNYNDVKKGITIEEGEPVIEERARYEELLSKGLVSVGEIVEEKKQPTDIPTKKIDKLDDIKL